MADIQVFGEGAALSGGAREDDARFLRDLAGAMAAETLRAYKSRFKSFSDWCLAAGRSPLPASSETVAAFIDALATRGRKYATIAQVVAAISKIHAVYSEVHGGAAAAPCKSERVRAALKRARNEIGVAQRQKDAATSDVMKTLIDAVDGSIMDKRDKALLLVGFAGAFRRSELAALRVSDLKEEKAEDGRPVTLVTVRRSKTDQEGRGMTKALFAAPAREKKYCPVRALREWIAAAGLEGDMPLFPRIRKGGHIGADPMDGGSVALIIKRRAAAAGVELDLAGHSLRRGFVTTAVKAGASERSIMYQTGHKSPEMVRRYIERKNAIEENAARMIRFH